MRETLLSQFLMTIAAFIVVVAGMRVAAPIIVPFLLAGFIATICFPAMVAMQQRGIGSGFAVLIILLVLTMALYFMVQFAGSSIARFSAQSLFYEDRLRALMDEWVVWLRAHNVNVERRMLEDVFNPSTALNVAVNTLDSMRVLVTNTFLILLTVVFILLEAAGLPNKLRLALGNDHPSLYGIGQFSHALNRYLGIKTLISLVTGVLVYLLLRALKIDFPVLWAVMAFLLNYVPNIGSIIAGVPPFILALVQFPGLGQALMCGIGFLAINVTMGNLVEPRVMGKGLGLSTLVVFLSLVFWGWVLGPVGMFRSVPLTMVIKIAMESNRDTQWISIMLGNDQRPAEEEAPQAPVPPAVSDPHVS